MQQAAAQPRTILNCGGTHLDVYGPDHVYALDCDVQPIGVPFVQYQRGAHVAIFSQPPFQLANGQWRVNMDFHAIFTCHDPFTVAIPIENDGIIQSQPLILYGGRTENNHKREREQQAVATNNHKRKRERKQQAARKNTIPKTTPIISTAPFTAVRANTSAAMHWDDPFATVTESSVTADPSEIPKVIDVLPTPTTIPVTTTAITDSITTDSDTTTTATPNTTTTTATNILDHTDTSDRIHNNADESPIEFKKLPFDSGYREDATTQHQERSTLLSAMRDMPTQQPDDLALEVKKAEGETFDNLEIICPDAAREYLLS
eukprot:c8243_g1_i1.p1 GENE.c8243_g1_i1~~c8243_g1_i1.p1  ORF type:complete len:318 (+),score=82.44 c8243_g1_i1:60-1013(+)